MAANRKPRKASFGNIRQLSSGRWQARYTGRDGKKYTARTQDGRPLTFHTRRAADLWLAQKRVQVNADEWTPTAPKVKVAPLALRTYADAWLVDRPLAILTRELYAALLKNHIYPTFGDTSLGEITSQAVRAWYAELATKTGVTARSHAYALLRTILATAVHDELIPAQPCNIRGAGRAKRAKEPQPATVAELRIMLNEMPPKYQLAMLLAAWCAPRFGELFELRRGDVDLSPERPRLRIRRSVAVTTTGRIVKGTKSEAGERDVDIPPHLIPAIRAHLADHAAPGRDGLLFPGSDGVSHMCEKTLRPYWYAARAAAGREDLTWHGLRHTGATLAAQAGATLKELMVWMGHSTPGTALLYQHANRGKEIAARLSDIAAAENVTPIADAPSAKKTKKPRRRPA